MRLGGLAAGAVAVAALLGGAVAPSAQAAPARVASPSVVGAPVAGIPQPCAPTHAWPTGAKPAEVRRQLAANTGLKLDGPGWDEPRNAGLVRVVWESLDALSCTDYLATVKRANPGFGLWAGPTRSWAWGDWGLTHPHHVTLDFGKWRSVEKTDKGRLVRILVHEIGHAWSRTPQAAGTVAAFGKLQAKGGNFGPYAHNVNENLSEVIGYYVARCALANPYDVATPGHGNKGHRYDAYYMMVRNQVFAGREFGPAVGTTASCAASPAPKPAAAVTRVLGLSLDNRASGS